MSLLSGSPIPPLRPDLDMQPFEEKGERLVLLSDLLGLDERAIVLPMAAAAVASLFDGKRSAKDVSAVLAGQNVEAPESDIQHLADDMDRHGLLDTPQSLEARKTRLAAFQNNPVRPFHGRLRGMPEKAPDMEAFLGKYLSKEDLTSGTQDPPIGLVAPHIDFFRGGEVYAAAYGELAKRRPPDLIVAVGVAHVSPRSPWVPTGKAFETPFGPLEADEGLLKKFRSLLWYDPGEEEWVHAKEHSLELQSLWLKYLWRDRAPKWLPILTSSFERFCDDRAPSGVVPIENTIDQFGKFLAEEQAQGRKIMILAGVDLAHVGRRFGDDFDIDDAVKARVEKADREGMDRLSKGDADAFFLGGVGDGAWRHVCGLSALYTAARLIRAIRPEAAGTPLAYGQEPDPAGGIVSFTAHFFE